MFTVGQTVKLAEAHTIYSNGHEAELPEGTEVTIVALNHEVYGGVDYVNADVAFVADVTFTDGSRYGLNDYTESFEGTLNVDLEL